MELAKNVYLDPETFGSHDLLTNTAKLKRFQAKKYYKLQIDEMYKEGELIVA